jgi:acid phosphatase family membrane protein YuiD
VTMGSIVARCLGFARGRVFYALALLGILAWGGPRYLPLIFHDRYIASSLLSMFCAQGMKPLTIRAENSRIPWNKAFKCGGMPSSHTAVVAALATSLGIDYGWMSPLFQMASVLGGIVIYDAVTLRRMVGEHSKLIKGLVPEREEHSHYRLGEMTGHTPLEASVGLLVGVACAVLLVWV